ncbi:uncharacterized protein LOC111020542 [Momordica charantia]|uniref:Uncharacterized protein LOC111020542 n=1 Tax=Momordica charantia TaxID=3673 RepID=A0A6J1DJ78_MOMCH|nr:uncharacterized protein LOC111020542 [Momordica charantia]
MVNRYLHLADYVEVMAEEEIVVPMNRSAEGVFDGENCSIGDVILHRFKRRLEFSAGDGFAVRIGFAGGGFGIGAGNALVSDVRLRTVHWSGRVVKLCVRGFLFTAAARK